MEIALIILGIIGYFVVGFVWLLVDGFIIRTDYGDTRKSGIAIIGWPLGMIVRFFAFVGRIFD